MSLLKALLFASTALGAAIPAAAHAPTAVARVEDASPALEVRQAATSTMWTAPSGTVGNIVGTFSDSTIDLGCSQDAVMDSVAENCNTEGYCNPSWTLTCPNAIDGTDEFTITVNEGDFQPWIHNGLIDAQRAAVDTAGAVTTKQVPTENPMVCEECSTSLSPRATVRS